MIINIFHKQIPAIFINMYTCYIRTVAVSRMKNNEYFAVLHNNTRVLYIINEK